MRKTRICTHLYAVNILKSGKSMDPYLRIPTSMIYNGSSNSSSSNNSSSDQSVFTSETFSRISWMTVIGFEAELA